MTRAFVVGNGPSLNITNLDLLAEEISFAVNNIHPIYRQTNWTPTHYVRAEEASGLETGDWIESMKVHLQLGCEIYCNNYFFRPQFGLKPNEHVHRIHSCYHYAKHFNAQDVPQLWHLPHICTFGSSVNVAVQLAHVLGFSPIYLVGCDLGYRDNVPSHFTPDYEHGREQTARYANLDTLCAHMVAARSCPDIYNATIGGELEVYERVNYDDLF